MYSIYSVLYQLYNFTPILVNNQVYTQGYYSEIKAFISQVEKRKAEVTTGLMSVRSTYELLQALQSTRKHSFGQNNDVPPQTIKHFSDYHSLVGRLDRLRRTIQTRHLPPKMNCTPK